MRNGQAQGKLSGFSQKSEKSRKEMEKNILAMRWGSLGDLLITLPAINLLRHFFPQAKIRLLSSLSYGGLLQSAGLVDEVIAFEGSKALSLFQPENKERALWLRDLDLVIAWLNKYQGEWLRVMKKRLGEKFIYLLAEDTGKTSLSLYFFQKTEEVLGLKEGSNLLYKQMARLPIQLEWSCSAEKSFPWLTGQPYVVIHPGSGGRAKRWRIDNFLKIAEWVASSGMGRLLVTGPAEEDELDTIANMSWAENWGWKHNPPLESLAWVLSRSIAYLGNDSGITHLAGLCGCPGLALFREENADLWAPAGNLKILAAKSVDEISVEAVQKEMEKLLF